MTLPKIYLAIDNCFASKRWTRPSEWMSVIRKLGVNCVEASADNECDALYMDASYLKDWVKEVKEETEKTGAQVVNLYSGHGTYATLGLTHTDRRVRDRMMNQWLKPMCDIAGNLNAGIGFFCHAFPDSVLQNPENYYQSETELVSRLSEVASYAAATGVGMAGVEQMYSPHQIPWTIQGTEKLLREIYKKSGTPFYITLDTGHQSGQRKFIRPSRGVIKEQVRMRREGKHTPSLWLGCAEAYDIFKQAAEKPLYQEDAFIEKIMEENDKHPYMFAEYEDGDTYLWLEKLACYSPIIHLQQTNGRSSAHWPFTDEYNSQGVIDGQKVLQAIYSAYLRKPLEGIPPKCDRIYLTLEIFSGTAELNANILFNLQQSVHYWRKFIPKDGMPLDELMDINGILE